MSKKSDRDVTKKERELWRFVTRHDKKLHADETEANFDIDSYAKEQSEKQVKAPPPPQFVFEEAVKNQLIPLKEGVFAGVDKRTAGRLKKGQLDIDATIDLHGCTQIEAFEALYAALGAASEAQKRVVLVITGKGKDNAGVLKQSLPLWLNAPSIRPNILAFSEATAKDGGSGAYYVLLKRKRANG